MKLEPTMPAWFRLSVVLPVLRLMSVRLLPAPISILVPEIPLVEPIPTTSTAIV